MTEETKLRILMAHKLIREEMENEKSIKKTTTNYNNTVIYKLICKDTTVNEIYVGSTVKVPQNRYSEHRSVRKSDSPDAKTKVYKFIRANGGMDNWELEVIEVFPCTSNKAKLTREKYWTDLLKAKLNVKKQIKD